MRRIGIRVFFGVLVLAIVLFLHWYVPSNWSPLAFAFLQSLHAPGFAVLSVVIFALIGDRVAGVARYVVTATLTILIGVVAELSQIPMGRAAQLSDLAVNAIGIAAALGIVATFDDGCRQWLSGLRRLVFGFFSFALLIPAVLPSAWLLYASVAQYLALPRMVTFESAWESTSYEQAGNRMPTRYLAPPDWPGNGRWVGHASEDGRWGILISLKPWPDWQAYSSVSFIAATTDDSTRGIGVAVRDQAADSESTANRFYTTLDIGPQPRRFTIDFKTIATAADSRPFNFSHVDAFILSAANPGGDVSLLIDDIELR